jgi:uncharacterized protein DUF2076
MIPEERQLIASLFDRLRSFGRPEKDEQAEALIAQSIRAIPDVPYMLVQSTLIQEQALEAANTRLQEAEERVRGLEEELQRRVVLASMRSWWVPRSSLHLRMLKLILPILPALVVHFTVRTCGVQGGASAARTKLQRLPWVGRADAAVVGDVRNTEWVPRAVLPACPRRFNNELND